MPNLTLKLLLLLLVAFPGLVHADLAQQRAQFEIAFKNAKQGKSWVEQAKDLRGYPLLPWVEHATLMQTAHPDTKAIEGFVRRHRQTYLAAELRHLLAKRYVEGKRWQDVLNLELTNADVESRCRVLAARIALDETTLVGDAAKALWLTPSSLPVACDPIIDWLRKQEQLDQDLVWQRIALTAQKGQASFVRQLANQLEGDQRLAAGRLADLLLDPGKQRSAVRKWPNDAAHQHAVALAVARIARRDDELAASLWRDFSAHLSFGDDDKALMLDVIALYRANSYRSDAADWLALIPVGKDSELTREWRVREALSRRDFSAALKGLSLMDAAQQADPRWRYWLARSLEETGQSALAKVAWQALATAANFHGFQAAERLNLNYQVCALDVPVVSTNEVIARYPGLEQALEFRAIGWKPQANRAWNHLLSNLDSTGRIEVVAVADQQSWFDRAPFALNGSSDIRLYTLRFALAHRALIEAAAKANGVDPSLVFGLIRSESAWVEDARSHADAFGLMQLLPSTARRMATLEGVSFAGTAPLLDPPLNVRLGTRYLAEVGKRYQDAPWMVAAAYNAGPARLSQWLQLRGHLPTDIFIETIPFKETREYVARVLAFTQLYDWRRLGVMRPISDRMTKQGERYRADWDATKARPVTCQN